MGLSVKIVGAIVGIIILSLSGLLILQIMQLNTTIELKEQAFRRNVLASMGLVSQKLATRHLIDAAMQGNSLPDSCLKQADQIFQDIDIMHTVSDTMIAKKIVVINGDTVEEKPIWVDEGRIHYNLNSPQRVQIFSYDVSSGLESVVLDTFSQPGDYSYEVDTTIYDEGQFLWKYRSQDISVVMEMNEGPQTMRRVIPNPNDSMHHSMYMTVIGSLFMFDELPLEDQLSVEQLDSLVQSSLTDYGIDLEYVFGVRSRMDDSITLVKNADYLEELTRTPYRAGLFPQTPFVRDYKLLLHFPGEQMYLWREASPMLLLSILFVIIITGCFAYTIRTIISQKRFAGHIIDFINNMTHEFKTPIATVRLACEAMDREDIRGDETKVMRYNEMIQNENLRMSNQTEKILQMAVLEEGKYKLQMNAVDAHAIINSVVESERLHVESRKGTIEVQSDAKKTIICADEIHLSNIIGNLMDNANKYSDDHPEISVKTSNIENDLLIVIEDKGKGINKPDQKYVFDKYYRVSAGNVHDVKGFGLGLSYVKLMTEAMGGAIILKSDIGIGTRITLSFPSVSTREVPDV